MTGTSERLQRMTQVPGALAPQPSRSLQDSGQAAHRPVPGALADAVRLAPGPDPVEAEADHIAEGVVSGHHVGQPPRSRASSPVVPPTGPALTGAGSSLPTPVRAHLEAGLGSDLGHVRLHTGPGAASAARAVGAAAFTSGTHIALGASVGDLTSPAASRVLAHEVAHVVHHDTSRVVRRKALPFDSRLRISHNLLYGESTFSLAAGEGVVVDVVPDWHLSGAGDEEWRPVDMQSEDRPPGLPNELLVHLQHVGSVWNSMENTCAATVGAWNRLVLRTEENGTHRLVAEVFDHNHNYALMGPIHVRKARADEVDGACGRREGMSGLELLHYALDAAGLVPALGIVPDGINAVIYAVEGDWTSSGISAAAMLPVFGQGATLTKYADKAAVRMSQRAASRLERRSVAAALRDTRAALKALRTPPVFAHVGNVSRVADPRLVQMAREARITQAGLTREAFSSVNVATARVRVGDSVQYLSSGNSPGRMMHSEDWILTQVQELKRSSGGRSVVVEQLYSERIPCRECLGKLQHLTNTDMFYTVRERGRRAADLMAAYGL